MNKKQKILFRASIAANIILAVIIVWGYLKITFATDQIFLTEGQDRLIELEGVIAHQIDYDWQEPNLVTVKVGDVMEGLRAALQTGDHLSSISSKEQQTFNQLYHLLRAYYPYDRIYSFTDVTERDKENLIELRELLRETGLGMNIQISKDMNTFMDQTKSLTEKIEEVQMGRSR